MVRIMDDVMHYAIDGWVRHKFFCGGTVKRYFRKFSAMVEQRSGLFSVESGLRRIGAADIRADVVWGAR